MWFVARVKPGSQTGVFTSTVERHLKERGFSYYMPAETRLIRDRRKANLYKERRFPIIPGYIFVRDVWDFKRLEETTGIINVIRFEGIPFPMPERDIDELKRIEAECEASFQREAARRAFAASKMTRGKAKRLFPSGSHVAITAGRLSGRHGFVSGIGRDGKIKIDSISGYLSALAVAVDANELELVAA